MIQSRAARSPERGVCGGSSAPRPPGLPDSEVGRTKTRRSSLVMVRRLERECKERNTVPRTSKEQGGRGPRLPLLSSHVSGSVGDGHIWSLALEAEGALGGPIPGASSSWRSGTDRLPLGPREVTPATGPRRCCVAWRPLPQETGWHHGVVGQFSAGRMLGRCLCSTGLGGTARGGQGKRLICSGARQGAGKVVVSEQSCPPCGVVTLLQSG